MPPDKYGNTILPRILTRVTLNGEVHPLEISGRKLCCTVHDNPISFAMGTMIKDEPACAVIRQQWRDYFAPAPERLFGDGVRVRLRESLQKYTLDIELAMLDEVLSSTDLTRSEFYDAMDDVPQIQVDPTFLSGIPKWASVREWAAYKRTRDDSILPYLKIHAYLSIDLTLSPEELSASIHKEANELFRAKPIWREPFDSVLIPDASPERITNRYIASIHKEWKKDPKLWTNVESIAAFVGHNVAADEIPALITYGVTPEEADRWSFIECWGGFRKALCVAFAPHRESRGDGYIATLAKRWNQDDLKFILPIMSEFPEQVVNVIEYQEAGWPPDAITALMNEQRMQSGVYALPRPVPEFGDEQAAPILSEQVDNLTSEDVASLSL